MDINKQFKNCTENNIEKIVLDMKIRKLGTVKLELGLMGSFQNKDIKIKKRSTKKIMIYKQNLFLENIFLAKTIDS